MCMAMRFKLYIYALILVHINICFPAQAVPQDKEDHSSGTRLNRLTLVEATMCDRIQEQAPMNRAIVFPVTIGKVLCFSFFDPVPEETFIHHYWFHRDKFITRIKLSLKPPRWSTFSSVQLREADKGPWRVEIRGQEGHILRILRFSITD